MNSERTDIHYCAVTAQGINVFYRKAGNPRSPTILLLHGFPTSSHMRRILHMTMFHWIDVGIISLIILLAFSYQTDPDLFHRTGTRPLAGLLINYVYKFVVLCLK